MLKRNIHSQHQIPNSSNNTPCNATVKSVFDSTTKKYVPKRIYPAFIEEENHNTVTVKQLSPQKENKICIAKIGTRNPPGVYNTDKREVVHTSRAQASTARKIEFERCRESSAASTYSTDVQSKHRRPKSKLGTQILQYLTNQFDHLKIRQKSYLL